MGLKTFVKSLFSIAKEESVGKPEMTVKKNDSSEGIVPNSEFYNENLKVVGKTLKESEKEVVELDKDEELVPEPLADLTSRVATTKITLPATVPESSPFKAGGSEDDEEEMARKRKKNRSSGYTAPVKVLELKYYEVIYAPKNSDESDHCTCIVPATSEYSIFAYKLESELETLIGEKVDVVAFMETTKEAFQEQERKAGNNQ